MKLCPKCQKHFSDDANFCPVDAARLVPLEAQGGGADSMIARFEPGAKLGGNRTGAVYRAVDKTTKAAAAVKTVAAPVLALPGVAQRLERELKQLERVKTTGVAQVIASGKRPSGAPGGGDETWIAMELLDGAQTLATSITQHGAIGIEQAAELIETIGEALIEAAQVGVVHRDLAPKNVIFAGEQVKLINFSLPVPTTDKVPGVAEFVAPEQIEGRPVDQRSNLYSLGALYYYVLTGRTLFAGSAEEVHRQHAGGTITPPSQLAAVGQPIEAVIMRSLERSPTKRFLTVRQFVDEVRRVGHGEVIELKSTMALGKANKPRGELVQTLLGVRGLAGMSGLPPLSNTGTAPGGMVMLSAQHSAPAPIAQPAPAPIAQPAPAPVAQPAPSAVPFLAAPVLPAQPAAAPAPAAQPIAQTMLGVPQSALGPIPGSTPMGMAPLAVAAPSPWAQPQSSPVVVAPIAQPQVQAPIAHAPVVAAPIAPVVAAPVVAAPVVAAPVVAAAQASAAAGKRGAEPGSSKGKFRETMWFKKGDLDAQAAVAAAEERAKTGKDVAPDKADSLPIDDRYKDDGSITRGDKDKYSLRTGSTQMMQSIQGNPAASMNKVSEDDLIGEMKGGRTKIFVAIGVALAVIAAIIVFVAR
jgi:hypothetical protein